MAKPEVETVAEPVKKKPAFGGRAAQAFKKGLISPKENAKLIEKMKATKLPKPAAEPEAAEPVKKTKKLPAEE